MAGFLTSASASLTTGTKLITISGSVDCSFVVSGTAVYINDMLMEGVSGTAADPSGNSTITLRNSYTGTSIVGGTLVAFNTIEGLRDAIQRARELSAQFQDGLGEITQTDTSLKTFLTVLDPTTTITFNDESTVAVTPYQVLVGKVNTSFRVVGTFLSGCTVTSTNEFIADAAGVLWRFTGNGTHIVAAGTTPSSPTYAMLFEYIHAGLPDINPADGSAHNAEDIKDTKYGGSVQAFINAAIKSFNNVNDMVMHSGHEIGNLYSTGRTTWEVKTTTNGISLGGGLYAVSISRVDPIDFGADNTGTSDSTAAFIAARDAAATATVWSYGRYKLKDYNILDNQHIVSENAIISPLDNTSTAVIANNKSGWSLTGKTVFLGHRATLADKVYTNETGLKIIDGNDFIVENVVLTRFKGLAFDRQGQTGAGTEYYGNRGQYSNILLYENIEAGKDSAEFEVFTNLNVIANERGFESLGGNLKWIGGNCTNNIDGFIISSGPNNGHGICTGVSFNHNTNRNILINRTADGFTFDGCHSYANDASGSGKIEIIGSGGIDFNGGTYDCWFEVDETFVAGIGDNFIRNIFAPGGYGPLKIVNQNGLRPATVLTSGIRGAGAINAVDGLNVNDIAPIAFLVKRHGSSSQSLISSVETVMTFTAIRPLGDTRGLLPAGTISTFPTPYKGYYSINLDAVIAGTTLDVDASYVAVYVDGVNQGYFYGRSIGSVSGKLGMKFTVSIKAYAESSIEFKAYVVGTDLVHAISVFDSKVEVLLING